jgi:hypothetical protein
MEENSILPELSLQENSKTNIASVAQWAFISAIVGFISLAISAYNTFSIKAPDLGDPTLNNTNQGGRIFGFLVTAGISLLLNITLLNAASNIKKGLTTTDQGHFNYGMSKLATYFQITGILLIIALVIVALAVLIIFMAGFGAA